MPLLVWKRNKGIHMPEGHGSVPFSRLRTTNRMHRYICTLLWMLSIHFYICGPKWSFVPLSRLDQSVTSWYIMIVCCLLTARVGTLCYSAFDESGCQRDIYTHIYGTLLALTCRNVDIPSFQVFKCKRHALNLFLFPSQFDIPEVDKLIES